MFALNISCFYIFRSSVAIDDLKIWRRIGPMYIACVNIGDDIAIGCPTSLAPAAGGQAASSMNCEAFTLIP
jgi:hypothetical protein